MTVVLAGAHKAAPAAGVRGHGAAPAADAGGGDSFMTMLAALDIDVADGTGAAAVAGEAIDTAGLATPLGEDAPGTGTQAGKRQQASDLLPPGVPDTNAALMAQAGLPAWEPATSAPTENAGSTAAQRAVGGVAAIGAASAAGGTAASARALPASDALPTGAVPATTATTVPTGESNATTSPVRALSAASVASVRPITASAAGTADPAAPAPAEPGAPARADTDPAAAVPVTAAATRRTQPEGASSTAHRTDPKLEAFQSALQAQAQTSTHAGATEIAGTASMAVQESTAHRPERERAPGTTSATDTDAGWKGLATATGGPTLLAPVDAASASAAGTHANLAERMVDQVSWWLSQKTQGAELSLNMPGGAPVSVSVQVQGNEAQVVFRSDHADARQALGDALPQLKAMFGSEGLMLTGASVGSSAGGAAGEAAARQAQQAAAGRQAATVDVPAAAAPVRRPASGRLDLYV